MVKSFVFLESSNTAISSCFKTKFSRFCKQQPSEYSSSCLLLSELTLPQNFLLCFPEYLAFILFLLSNIKIPCNVSSYIHTYPVNSVDNRYQHLDADNNTALLSQSRYYISLVLEFFQSKKHRDSLHT